MEILRKEAIDVLAFRDLIGLNREEREAILVDAFQGENWEEEEVEIDSPEHNGEILSYLKYRYRGIKNSYLTQQLNHIFDARVLVVGEVELLLACACCQYKTIERRGEYSVCPICFWKDDGTLDLQDLSPVNLMTLGEARGNYKKAGVVSELFQEALDLDGPFKYVGVLEE